MRLSKSQLAVITVLNVIIAALLVVIFLLPEFVLENPPHGDTGGGNGGGASDGDGSTADVVPEPHNKFRDAQPGKATGIVRETQLMGSGDETALGVFYADGVLYVFGNATVGDYDFDSYGGFLCRLDESGKITAYDYFSGRMTAVTVIEGGFAVGTVAEAGTSDERNSVYFAEYGGTPREVITVDGAVRDIMAVDNGHVAVVSQRNDNCITLAEYAVGGDGMWKRERSTDIASGYRLEYFDCYMLGNEYTVAVRASSLPRYDSVAFFSFTVGGDPTAHFYGGSGDNMLQPYAVMPYSLGYIVAARRAGKSAVIGIDYSFTSYRRDLLETAADDGSLFFDGRNYYATFAYGDDTVTYALGETIEEHAEIAAFAGKTPLRASDQTHIFAASADSLYITDADGMVYTNYDAVDAQVYFCGKNADGTITAVLSASGGSALSATVGGRDLYVLCLSV